MKEAWSLVDLHPMDGCKPQMKLVAVKVLTRYFSLGGVSGVQYKVTEFPSAVKVPMWH